MKSSSLPFKIAVLLVTTFTLTACSWLSSGSGQTKQYKDMFKTYAGCVALEHLQSDMPYEPLFELDGQGACNAVQVRGKASGNYFADAQCQNPVFYRQTKFEDFCRDVGPPFAKDRLGNAAAWAGQPQGWTLYPGSRFNIGVLSIADNDQPYMTRVNYVNRNTGRGNGTCQLEMQIYKSNVNDSNLKPMLAIHGGAWKYRGVALSGFLTQLSHFTDEGFVVFAPFYRLVGESDGNVECNGGIWSDPIDDVASALDWVKQNGDQYGAKAGEKITLMGGSAGAHLALWLHTYHAQDIRKTVLFYPPADFAEYIGKAQQTPEQEPGESIMALYLGEPFNSIDLNSEKVVKNTFPPIIESSPSQYPPVFMLHGVADSLVPSIQSVRLCNALAGDIDNGPAVNDGGNALLTFRKHYQCSNDSDLILVAEGEHGLDACLWYLDQCPAGSYFSQRAVRDSIRDVLKWVK